MADNHYKHIKMILDNINNPKDLKGLSVQQLESLADEIRQVLIHKMNISGGHFGPNLGVVEATIAYINIREQERTLVIDTDIRLVFEMSLVCHVSIFKRQPEITSANRKELGRTINGPTLTYAQYRNTICVGFDRVRSIC